MIQTCFLHIGTEKTGTTSIQNFLAKNRSQLLDQGILYPRSPGKENHVALAVYALRKVERSGLGRSYRIPPSTDVSPFRGRLRTELDKELRPATASAVIFSNEHLSSRLSTEREIERVKTLCDRYAERTKVVVYLRNQVDFLVSSFGTAIKSGRTRKFPFPLTEGRIRAMDYLALLDPWKRVFGRENMIVRRFERERFVDGDLLSDFAAQIPFATTGFVRTEPRNEALGARELAFLREFNARVPIWLEGDAANPVRGDIVAALANLGETGPRLAVSPEIAATIMGQFEESNARVAAEYFGAGNEPLFSPPQLVADVDVHELLTLKCSDVMDIACKLWHEQEEQVEKLERRRKKRRSRDSEWLSDRDED